ncbi:MAG: MBL fold metallo-hydrolase, partial [Litorivicinus sp.]
VPVYASAGTALGARIDPFVPIRDGEAFAVGDIQVTPVLVPHDAREPTQFVFEWQGKRLGVCTDLGSISRHVVGAFQDLDAVLLEANYDPQMLENGPYPPKLRARVGGDFGHLSNQQSAQLLGHIAGPRLKRVVACHISEKNNRGELVHEALSPVVPPHTHFEIASQTDGCTWIDLAELAHG